MSEQPLVSVIVPTKNSARYLRDAIDSIEAQTYETFEIVVVDAASDDATLEIAGGYERVRLVHQAGDGLADAWNCGLEAARGELIAFLDSDDRWEPEKLSKQVRALVVDAAVDCVITNMRFVLEPGYSVPPGFRPELLESDHIGYLPSALLARRAVFERIGAFDTRWRITPDTDWFARLKDTGLRLRVVPEVLVNKRVHDTNLSTLGGDTVNRELVQLLRESVERRRGSR